MKNRRAVTAGAVLVAALAVNCGGDGGTGPGTADISVAELQFLLQRNLASFTSLPGEIFSQAANLAAGGNLPGFSVDDQGGGRYGIASEGGAQTSLSAVADISMDGGGNVVSVIIDVLNFARSGGASGSGGLTAEVIGGSGDPDTAILLLSTDGVEVELAGDGGSIRITEAGYTLDRTFAQSPFLEGYIDFGAGNLSATMYFEANGLGGWGTRVEGDKGGEPFEFTIP